MFQPASGRLRQIGPCSLSIEPRSPALSPASLAAKQLAHVLPNLSSGEPRLLRLSHAVELVDIMLRVHGFTLTHSPSERCLGDHQKGGP